MKIKKAIDIENIQVKLVSNKKGYNQVDKRLVNKYKEMWEIPDDICEMLKYFTGELPPYIKGTKSLKRMFITEFEEEQQIKIINWITSKKVLIVSDILKGRGEFCAEWILVAQKINCENKWVLKNINEVLQHYSQGEVKISPRGSIKIGKITMQRKGYDNGRPTGNMLQFKIDPTELIT